MKRLAKTQKIFLMVLSAISISGCNSAPEFPGWNPKLVIPSQNKYFKCHLIDKDRFLFECDKQSQPIGADVDSHFCQSSDETKKIINWARDIKEHVKRNCGDDIFGL